MRSAFFNVPVYYSYATCGSDSTFESNHAKDSGSALYVRSTAAEGVVLRLAVPMTLNNLAGGVAGGVAGTWVVSYRSPPPGPGD